jgi:glycosyltransferase involved in cell wall biosynthesis
MSSRPRIFLNASTCVVGGGVQVAVGFLHYIHHQLDEIGWEVVAVASPQVYQQCKALPARPGWRLELITPSPASVLGGWGSRRRIHKLIGDFNAHLCFTIFGPSYLWLDIPEVSGFADPSVTNPNEHFLRNHPFGQKLRTLFTAWVKTLAVRRVLRFWVETATAQAGLARRLSISPERITVVPNALNRLFVPLPGAPSPGRIRILHLSAYYPHKNHAFLLPVAKVLRRLYPAFDFEFVVTLPQDGQPWKELSGRFKQAGMADRLRTAGYLEVKDCPMAYRDCHVVFHPSLLEVFSATYLEAFAAERPVVATDLDFAHEVCGDAAVYFDPSSPEIAASALFRAATDQNLRDNLINKGLIRRAIFPKANDKNQRLLSLIAESLPCPAS